MRLINRENRKEITTETLFVAAAYVEPWKAAFSPSDRAMQEVLRCI